MRVAMFAFSGTATKGDFVSLSYVGSRGGQSNVCHRVTDTDTLATIVASLAEGINSAKGEWSPGNGDFKAVAGGDTLTVMIGDLMSDVKFLAQSQGLKIGDGQGPGTEIINISVLG